MQPKRYPAIAELPVFDRCGLLERLDGHEEYVPRLVSVYIRNAEENCCKLCDAVYNNDRYVVRAKAHAIHGSSANIGASRVERMASKLEDSAIEGRPVDIVMLYKAIIQELNSFKESCGNSSG